jgi:hypothetical protein
MWKVLQASVRFGRAVSILLRYLFSSPRRKVYLSPCDSTLCSRAMMESISTTDRFSGLVFDRLQDHCGSITQKRFSPSPPHASSGRDQRQQSAASSNQQPRTLAICCYLQYRTTHSILKVNEFCGISISKLLLKSRE